MSGRDDVEDRRRYNQPYTPKHTIPTIQKYREEKESRAVEATTPRSGVEDLTRALDVVVLDD